MGVGEEHATFGQTVDMCMGLRVTVEAAHPVLGHRLQEEEDCFGLRKVCGKTEKRTRIDLNPCILSTDKMPFKLQSNLDRIDFFPPAAWIPLIVFMEDLSDSDRIFSLWRTLWDESFFLDPERRNFRSSSIT